MLSKSKFEATFYSLDKIERHLAFHFDNLFNGKSFSVVKDATHSNPEFENISVVIDKIPLQLNIGHLDLSTNIITINYTFVKMIPELIEAVTSNLENLKIVHIKCPSRKYTQVTTILTTNKTKINKKQDVIFKGDLIDIIKNVRN